MTDQQFRRDYWVKGLQKISRVEQLEQFRSLRVMLTKYKSDIELKISGMRGSITLKEEIYNPIIDYLALNPSQRFQTRIGAREERRRRSHNISGSQYTNREGVSRMFTRRHCLPRIY